MHAVVAFGGGFVAGGSNASGSMHGSYFCVAEDGEPFTCPIELFVLEAFSPGQPGQPMAARVLH